MSRVVRSSKYRHVFGTPNKKDKCLDDVKVIKASVDGNFLAVNPKYWAVCWNGGGGGSVGVGNWDMHGKWNPNWAFINGHKSTVVDVDWMPSNDNVLASASEDGYAKIWVLKDDWVSNLQNSTKDQNLTEADQNLAGHKRGVKLVRFNPTAENILATVSLDLSVKVWDISKGAQKYSLEGMHADQISGIDWNFDGSLLASTCKDKKIRILDPRQSKVAAEAESHGGTKQSRAIWLGDKEKIISCGFSKTASREYKLFDPKKLDTPLVTETIDTSSGYMMPFYDNDTQCFYLGGKGDGNIRYYEVVDEAPYLHGLSEFKVNTSCSGLAMMAKRGVNVSGCEVVRMVRLVNSKMLEPVSFVVPRKSDLFQEDIFPPAASGEPTNTADEWCSGKSGPPKTVSLEGGFVAKPKTVVFEKKEEIKELSPKELKDENEKLSKRVAYLESEIIKKDQKIKELGG